MKNTTKELDNIAEEWSGAYSADKCGREVSIEIIKALFDFGFNKEDAKEVYFSKNLRWFFDSQGDQVSKAEAKKKFTSYLKKNIQNIRSMFLTELNRKCSA